MIFKQVKALSSTTFMFCDFLIKNKIKNIIYASPKKLHLHLKSGAGFTLIELLVVIAVIGVMASVIAVAINPAEQMARARDSNRKSIISQLANAVQAYSIVTNSYPSQSTTWITDLVNLGEIKKEPSNSSLGYTPTCGKVPRDPADEILPGNGIYFQNGFCFKNQLLTPPDVLVFVQLESQNEISKCTKLYGSANKYTYYTWNSKFAKIGYVCTNGTWYPGVNASPDDL